MGIKLKGSGPINFHLGCDFLQDDHGVSCMAPTKYIERLVSNHQQYLGSSQSSRSILRLKRVIIQSSIPASYWIQMGYRSTNQS